ETGVRNPVLAHVDAEVGRDAVEEALACIERFSAGLAEGKNAGQHEKLAEFVVGKRLDGFVDVRFGAGEGLPCGLVRTALETKAFKRHGGLCLDGEVGELRIRKFRKLAQSLMRLKPGEASHRFKFHRLARVGKQDLLNGGALVP